tara:strand:- start:1205 stop:2215 length:1011 start_codon:yes stop_codon:yes gene_type:complete
MKVLSLFDGVAGCRQALKELNIDCEYYGSEIDKYAIQVAKDNHPDINHIGDVKGLVIEDDWLFYNQNNDPMQNGASFKANFDLLIGGSPCQDLSIAKKNRKGLQGDRSSLFYEYLRILNEVKPKYFILENVASMSKESKNIITKELFNIEPIMINSALLTAQNRKRLYWIGKLIDGEYEQVKIEQPKDQEIYLKDILENGAAYQEKSHSLTASYNGAVFWNSIIKKQRTMVPVKLGHFNKGGQGDRIYSVDGKSVCLSANGGGGGGGGGRGAKTGLYAIDLPNGKYTIRKLTPTECCRLQGFTDDYVSIVSKTQGYKGLGNSFTVPVIKHILTNLK